MLADTSPAIAFLAILPVLLGLHYLDFRKNVKPTLGSFSPIRTIPALLICVWIFADLGFRERKWLVTVVASAFVLFIGWTCGGFHARSADPGG